jgi:hypothetical protein
MKLGKRQRLNTYVGITEPDIIRLDALMDRYQCSRSALIRMAIRSGLNVLERTAPEAAK